MTDDDIYTILMDQEIKTYYEEGLREWARKRGTLDALQIEAARRAEALLPQEAQPLDSLSIAAPLSPQQSTPTQQPVNRPLTAMERVQADMAARFQRRGH